MDNAFSKTFRAAAIIVSIPLGFLFFAGVSQLALYRMLIPGAVLTLLWGSYGLLKLSVRGAFTVSYCIAATLWLGLLYNTIRRVTFVLREGQMEATDGTGSPLAFLVGMFFEQWLFLPLSAVMVGGVVHLINSRKSVLTQLG